jgi:hypothetical protein
MPELSPINRRDQILLIASLLPLCWFGMMAVHEFGHVAAAWVSGGSVERVVLHPLTISRTDVSPNPHPAFVVWAGPIVGVLLPLLIFLVIRALRGPTTYLWRFFAGFCLVANGLYLGVGSVEPVGDARDLLRHGMPRWLLGLFGLATVPLGFFLWNGQGKHFGRGESRLPISRRHAIGVCGLLVFILVVEFLLSPAE